MREREQNHLAITGAETMYNLMELENRKGDADLVKMMLRLKDLSAYSLAHAEIMDQREGIELLALATFFGATSNPRFRRNQPRLYLLSEQTIAYQGDAEVIEQEVAQRNAKGRQKMDVDGAQSWQPLLL